ncbi:D-erythronate dehydrogenase [Psychromarinibacter halotolerans]|mgnify:CR=1 FL=1|uniref:D-erythronate dehydrogenase n=1 Tax=Psychromarinibacter halotolerans TaxID=1775175 RepID=A0ABV7GND7_9RHOB|nr:D-erythronate dehydrogenase [Psychromarinibacter halotolerans]MAQ86223.1 NAD-dependent epimerase [Maritimibacter sp.]MDF0596625.1 SDR family oxidoreductase [Psychromarinibacter halotolerans]
MRRVLIIGGGGMVGQKLAHRLSVEGLDGDTDIEVTLFDMAYPEGGAPAAERIVGQLGNFADIDALVAARYDVIFHLAAIVSGESESDFQKGWLINGAAFLHFGMKLEEEHRVSGGAYVPRVVFTSSIAVFGPPFPDQIPDDQPLTPQTSYGAQKACAELMMNDLGRRGIVEAVSIRLPTIVVRPGKPNLAASSFFSGIIREPLNGQEAILPVDESVRHWHASPRAAVGFLIHAAGLDTALLGDNRALSMPGVSCTVAEQIESLRAAAGDKAVALIRHEPNETIQRIVGGWARDFDPARALALGFRADADFDAIVRAYIEDYLTD